MELGCFSISLAVADLVKSKEFYEKIGFKVYAGEESNNFLIMKNGDTNIGLFQGMFDKNILTFNPGWDQNAQAIESYTDVRELKKEFTSQEIEIVQDSIDNDKGPASFSIVDPDGNTILIDQHV